MNESFEQGPIRPPSEAGSLLLRMTRNCPWNHCAFCNSYKNTRFTLRGIDEIMLDIDNMSAIADRLREHSLREGENGHISQRILQTVWDRYPFFDEYDRTLALWLHRNENSVFLQDADSLVMKTDDVLAVLRHLRTAFPSINRITTYCRSHTAARKSADELTTLKEAGLTRIHVGLESGSDTVLKLINKGSTAAGHIEAGKKIKAAGMELSEYVIPGLGGEACSSQHAHETASVINAINPDFIRLRTLHVVGGTPLMEMIQQGIFTPSGDEDILMEIREFIAGLEGIEAYVVSDHILNLLEEIEGKIPDAKAAMLNTIDRYFALPEEKRLIFRLGRRKGHYRSIDQMVDDQTYQELRASVLRFAKNGKKSLDNRISTFLNGNL